MNGKNVEQTGYEVLPQHIVNSATGPGSCCLEGTFIPSTLPVNTNEAQTEALWRNFLECVRHHNRATLSTPELGAAAFTTVNMGVQSYRQGRVLFWDKDNKRPKTADDSWATRWETRSHQRGQCKQIDGWQGGNTGSTLQRPAWQYLEGDWGPNNVDPAPATPPTPPPAPPAPPLAPAPRTR